MTFFSLPPPQFPSYLISLIARSERATCLPESPMFSQPLAPPAP